MSDRKTPRLNRARVQHHVVWIGAALAVVLMVGCATYYLNSVTIQQVDVSGAEHASVPMIMDLSGVAVGDTLFRLDADLIASRVTMHPWIEKSNVTRWPTGVLSIEVQERQPVALTLSEAGTPAFYLDRSGESLPVDTLSRYDVPLIRGVAHGSHPVAVRDSTTLELLSVLASLSPSVDGLLSDLVVRPDGEVEAVTVPVQDGHCIRVRLGRGDFERKMKTLKAFWMQAVAGFPNKRIDWIDLRYRGQVVTKEESVIS
jgi:cell division septal protein FtsQ